MLLTCSLTIRLQLPQGIPHLGILTGTPTVYYEDNKGYISAVEAKRVTPMFKHIYSLTYFLLYQYYNGIFTPKYEKTTTILSDISPKYWLGTIISHIKNLMMGFWFYSLNDSNHLQQIFLQNPGHLTILVHIYCSCTWFISVVKSIKVRSNMVKITLILCPHCMSDYSVCFEKMDLPTLWPHVSICRCLIYLAFIFFCFSIVLLHQIRVRVGIFPFYYSQLIQTN